MVLDSLHMYILNKPNTNQKILVYQRFQIHWHYWLHHYMPCWSSISSHNNESRVVIGASSRVDNAGDDRGLFSVWSLPLWLCADSKSNKTISSTDKNLSKNCLYSNRIEYKVVFIVRCRNIHNVFVGVYCHLI